VRVSLRLGGRFVDRLHPVEAELTGKLVPEGAVLGSQAGDLGAGGVEPLAERAGGCALRGERGGRWFVLAEVADGDVRPPRSRIASLPHRSEPAGTDDGLNADPAQAPRAVEREAGRGRRCNRRGGMQRPTSGLSGWQSDRGRAA
jgi:hypothetical protein